MARPFDPQTDDDKSVAVQRSADDEPSRSDRRHHRRPASRPRGRRRGSDSGSGSGSDSASGRDRRRRWSRDSRDDHSGAEDGNVDDDVDIRDDHDGRGHASRRTTPPAPPLTVGGPSVDHKSDASSSATGFAVASPASSPLRPTIAALPSPLSSPSSMTMTDAVAAALASAAAAAAATTTTTTTATIAGSPSGGGPTPLLAVTTSGPADAPQSEDAVLDAQALVTDVPKHILKGRRRFSRYSQSDEPPVARPFMWLARVAVGALAIGLIWVTTLDLCRSLAALYFPAPDPDRVYDSWSVTIETTRTESLAYSSCAQRMTAQCHARVNVTVGGLVDALHRAQTRNADRVARATVAAQDCSQGLLTVLDAFDKFTKAGGTIAYRDANFTAAAHTAAPNGTTNGTADGSGGGGGSGGGDDDDDEELAPCSADELALLQATFHDASQVKQNAFVLSAQFARATDGLLRAALDAANNRTAYDQAYLARKAAALGQVSPAVQAAAAPFRVAVNAATDALVTPIAQLLKCTTGTGVGVGCPPPFHAVVAEFEQRTAQVEAFLALLATGMQKNIDRTNAYVNDLTTVFVRARNFVSFIASHYDVLRDAMPPDNPLPALPSLTFYGSLQLVDVQRPLPGIGPLSSFWAARVAPLEAWIDAQVDAVQARVDADMAALQAALVPPTIALPDLFADYNPPAVTVATGAFADASAAFLTQSALALNAFDQLPTPGSADGSAAAEAVLGNVAALYASWGANASFSVPGARALFDLRSETTFRSAAFSGSFQFYPLLLNLKYLLVVFLIGDYAYRAYASVKQAVDFWSSSAVNLPTVDVRKVGAPQGSAAWSDTPMRALRCLTSDTCFWCTCLVVGAIAVVPLASVYLPLYDAYHRGCVDSRNGTLLTDNLYSLMYNYAALDGNRELTLGLESYDQLRIDACTQHGTSSVTTLNEQRVTLQATGVQAADTRGRLGVIRRCVRRDALPDAATFRAMTGVDHPFDGDGSGSAATAGVTLSGRLATCDAAVALSDPRAPLANATFDCNRLPKCTVTCRGPHEPDLRYATLVTGCRTEWFLHSWLLQTFLAALVYVCANLSRYAVVGAVCRLAWTVLVPHGLTFVGTCTVTGKATAEMRDRLRTATRDAIARFRNTAFLLLACAVVSHVPYLLVMALLATPVPPWQTA